MLGPCKDNDPGDRLRQKTDLATVVREEEMILEKKKECPFFIAFLAVACTVLAALGDWKVLNNAYGGLPKVVALGTIVCAFLHFLVVADFSKLKRAAGYFPIFLLLILLSFQLIY